MRSKGNNFLLTIAAFAKLQVTPALQFPRTLIARHANALIRSTPSLSKTKHHRHHNHHYLTMDSAEYHHQSLADRAHDASTSKRGGRGPKGSSSGRKGGREVDISRALSRLLRHQASSAGITLDAEGYAPLDKALAWGPIRSLKPTFEEILKAVRESDKQRFAIKLASPPTSGGDEKGEKEEWGKEELEAAEQRGDAKEWLIRANQGHSIKLESEGLLRRLVLPGQVQPTQAAQSQPQQEETTKEGEGGTVPVPQMVVHGTYFAFWEKIVASGGLKPMGRNHVHFSTGLPEDTAGGVISGMRSDAEVLVFVDVERSIREEGEGNGIKWWMSDNGVVLTEGDKDGLVPLKYFKEVRGRRQGVGLLWKDGEKVTDLPEGLEVRMPMGKGRAGGGGKGGRGGRGGGKGGRGREKKGDELKPQEVDSQ